MISRTRPFFLWMILFAAHVQANPEMTPEKLIESSPVIAVIHIESAPPPRIEDAALDPKIFKQRVPAVCIKRVKGDIPEHFLIENEQNSIITAGDHLAFLKPLDNGRYIMSSPNSLRTIREGNLYWFSTKSLPLSEVIAIITKK